MTIKTKEELQEGEFYWVLQPNLTWAVMEWSTGHFWFTGSEFEYTFEELQASVIVGPIERPEVTL